MLRLLFFLLIVPISSALVVNEIMYDPAGDDNNNEWVELYNNDSTSYNVTNLTVGDLSSNDTLARLQGGDTLSPAAYAIIGESGINLSLYPGLSVFSAGASIGNGLGNSNDTVYVYQNATVLDSIAYLSSQGGSGGKTLCRNATSQIAECEPTPGLQNIPSAQDVKIEVILNSTSVNQSNTALFRIEIDSKSCSFMDNVTVAYNITNSTSVMKQDSFTKSLGCAASSDTGSWAPGAAGIFSVCGAVTNTTARDSVALNSVACKNVTVSQPSSGCELELGVDADPVLPAGLQSTYYLVVNDTACSNSSHSISISYWIESLFSSVERNETTEQNIVCFLNISRQWTPESLEGSEGYFIKANITSPSCPDTDRTNNFRSRLVAVKGPEKISYINITSVDAGSDNALVFGEAIDVTVEIYRNSTQKYAVDAWIKNLTGSRVSEISTFHASSKLTKYRIKMPVQTKSNCDGAFPDGTHTITVEGLEAAANATVNISGISSSTCKTVTASASGSSGSSSSGSSGSSQPVSAAGRSYEMVSYPDRLMLAEKFRVKVRVENTGNETKNFSLYSYIYDGSKPLTLGLSDGRWSGEWAANRKYLSLAGKQASIVHLESAVENSTLPGKYRLVVKIIDGGKEQEFSRDVEIFPRPRLEVKASGNIIELENNCDGCEMLVLPEAVAFDVQKSSIEVQAGRHFVLLLRNGAIIERVSVETAAETGSITGRAANTKLVEETRDAARFAAFVLIRKLA